MEKSFINKVEDFVARWLVKTTDVLTRGISVKGNKVTFISYTNNVLSSDMKLISNFLEKNKDCNMVFLTKKFDNTLINKLKYLYEFILQTYHINTSRVVVIDGNNFAVSNVKKKEETVVVQIWHACGAIKKFGCDYSRRYAISNYDYVITSSSASKKCFASAFHMPEDRILPLGVAKTDRLFDKSRIKRYRNEMAKKYPCIEGKKVVLYAPTFRGDGVFSKSYMDIDLDKFAEKLSDDYIIMYKMHPISQYNKKQENCNIINVCDESLYRLFAISDMLVTDYSAIMYDYLILEKPIYFYTPDLGEYVSNRGIYWDYENYVPGTICYTEEELAKNIINKKYDLKKVNEMKNQFFDYLDGNSTKRIGDFILRFLT